ncbi:unnamed protein product [Linum trigynum]|uniref:Gnk2-homologous domain-containing protein n=1 Tax=Linum trigynum TaxID=586398 RepID=A0AAV2EBM2_9ROSI
MGFPFSKQPITPFSFFCCVSAALCLGFFVSPSSAADVTSLIFKGCSDQKFQDPSGISAQNLKDLFQSLVSQSAQKPYSTASSGAGAAAINGLYQCRGDLSTAQCYDCVGRIPDKFDRLCGGGAPSVAARVQLAGCYLKYEVAGFKQTPETQLLFKVCGSTTAAGDGFQQRRDAALDAMANGLKSGGGNGVFATGSYQSVFYLAQCEGDLAGGGGECGNCVKSAVEAVKTQCGGSIGGQAYLNKCYVSYTYYPNGVPIIDNTSGGGGGKPHTARTVAIVVGGVAAVGFLVACLLCVKSALKRNRGGGGGGKHGHGGGGGGWN